MEDERSTHLAILAGLRASCRASGLDAFRQLLRGGKAGELFTTGDPAALARPAGRLLDDPGRRVQLSRTAQATVAQLDWSNGRSQSTQCP